MRSRTRHRPIVVGMLTTATTMAMALVAMTASAHVTVSSDTEEPGSYAVLTFSIPHGCDGSPTTALSLQVPQGINAATPTRNPFWTVESVLETLTDPLTDSHGNEVSQRVSEIVWTATTPLPDDQRDTLEVSLQLPEQAPVDTLWFPVVQTCEHGETAWVQVPADGQDPHELSAPAPSITLGSNLTTQGPGLGTPLLVTSLVMAAIGMVAGLVSLNRGGRRR